MNTIIYQGDTNIAVIMYCLRCKAVFDAGFTLEAD